MTASRSCHRTLLPVLTCLASFLFAASTKHALLPAPFTSPPLVGLHNSTCDSPPPFLSFHVHVVFDGTDPEELGAAIKARHAFEAAFADVMRYNNNNNNSNDNGEQQRCPFSHPDPAPDVDYICPFAWNASTSPAVQRQPFTGVGLFGGEDYAYFLPKALYLRAELWWRQHHASFAGLRYLVHGNTGCEDSSHTEWALINPQYKFVEQKTDGLWCCHQGPPGCYCDLVLYEALHEAVAEDGRRVGQHSYGTGGIGGGTGKCLSPASGATGTDPGVPLALTDCGAAGDFGLATWRETHYLNRYNRPQQQQRQQRDRRRQQQQQQQQHDRPERLVQLENYGPSTLNRNTYLCLGATRCAAGEAVRLLPCKAVGPGGNTKVSWQEEREEQEEPEEEDHKNGDADHRSRASGHSLDQTGQIKVDSCRGLCVAAVSSAGTAADVAAPGQASSAAVVRLERCDSSTISLRWKRRFID